MSQNVYSTRFFGVIDADATFELPIDDAHVAIVRDMDFFLDGVPDDSGASVGVLETGQIIFDVQLTTDYQNAAWRGRQVLNPGETLRLVIGGSTNVSVSVSGYLLTLP